MKPESLSLTGTGPLVVLPVLGLSHRVQLIGAEAATISRIPLPNNRHPRHLFNTAIQGHFFEYSDHLSGIDPAMILFDRSCRGRIGNYQADTMPVGTISQALGISSIVPSSGEIIVPLVGSLIYEYAYLHSWLGMDYAGARALQENQSVIPDNVYVRSLEFLFPGTIVFRPETGVCIPALIFNGAQWIITYRDITTNVISGVDMWMK